MRVGRVLNVRRAQSKYARAKALVRGAQFEGGGSGEGSEPPKDEEALKRLQSWLGQETAGLKANRDALIGEKRKLEEDFEALKKQWEGLDPKAVRSLLEKFKNDREQQLIAEGKIDEALDARTEAMRLDFESKTKAASARIEELEKALEGKTGKIRDLLLDAAIRDAAPEDLEPTAIVDAMRAARDVFQLDENDGLVARNTDGSPKYGKDGKSPFSAAEWYETTKATYPHWYKRSSGSGAAGGGDGRGKGLSTDDLDNMSAREKLKRGISRAA